MDDKLPIIEVARRIFLIRAQKVMLSTHLAELYGVEPKVLAQSMKRNIERFPDDFAFQLNRAEFEILKCQFGTSSWGGLRRAMPYAFTQEGVAMLSSVLRSKRAVQINISIMRAFVQLREMLASNHELAQRLAAVERKQSEHDNQIRSLFDAMSSLTSPPAPERPILGFRPEKSG